MEKQPVRRPRGKRRRGPAKPHKRAPKGPPLVELAEIRKRKGWGSMYFASMLGITRMHVTHVERGWRQPSADLAARWLALLGPEAKLAMFGPLPHVDAKLRAAEAIRKLQDVQAA